MPKLPTKEVPPTTKEVETKVTPLPVSKPKSKPKTEPDRPVIFPEEEVKICTVRKGRPITVSMAKELLGWDEITEGKLKDDYLLVDENFKKIICTNNAKNRPFNEGWCRQIAQDILNKNYKFNGESIIIGKTGLVLSAQHRLIGLVLASQLWSSEKQKEHWKQYWEEEPYIESIIVFGIDESEETVRTLDNTRPRGFSDVLVTSGMFDKASRSVREKLAKLTSNAIRLVWDRSGFRTDPYSPSLTNSELTEFISNHKRIAQAVQHIFSEDQKTGGSQSSRGAISDIISPGYASGLMFLMGSCNSDPDKYKEADPKTEKSLDWSMWEKAREFWMLLGSGAPPLRPIRVVIGNLFNSETMTAPSQKEKEAVLVKAWNLFKEGKSVSEKALSLDEHYKVNEDGEKKFTNPPSLGGIDRSISYDEDDIDQELTQAEIEAEALAIRKQRQENLRQKQGGGGVDKKVTDDLPELPAARPPKKAPTQTSDPKKLKGGL